MVTHAPLVGEACGRIVSRLDGGITNGQPGQDMRRARSLPRAGPAVRPLSWSRAGSSVGRAADF